MTQAVDLSAPQQAPDWQAVSYEVTCPLCEYNLRGLVEARCPECGYRFIWSELLASSRKPHPYLFEHHRRYNIRSFLLTAWVGLRPMRFWQELTPLHLLKLPRLRAYWLIATLLGLLGPAMLYFQDRIFQTFAPPLALLFGSSSVDWRFHSWGISWDADEFRLKAAEIDFTFNHISAAILIAAVLVLWPPATLATLTIFRASLRRAKVRRAQVMRCIIYSADGSIWLGLAAALIVLVYATLTRSGLLSPPALCILLLVGWWILFARKLSLACRFYLQMDHPLAMVLSTQVILAMILLILVL